MVLLPGELHAARLARRENSPIYRIDTGLLDSVKFSEHFEYTNSILYYCLDVVYQIQDTRIMQICMEPIWVLNPNFKFKLKASFS